MHAPNRLFDRDYRQLTPEEEIAKIEYLKNRGDIFKTRPMDLLPIAVRNNLSLFPNNRIELFDLKQTQSLESLNQKFSMLVYPPRITEREVLNFINRTLAYHIIGSILVNRYPFGRHECYLFKELWPGNDYRTDYVLIGKGSGGYEFIFIELERPDGRITLKDGHPGEAVRKGEFQIEGHFSELSQSLKEATIDEVLPKVVYYDSDRFHYVVVSGLRSDYNDKTYSVRRKKN